MGMFDDLDDLLPQNQTVRKSAQFDPEGSGYDESLARESGATPDENGHWPSIDPRTGMVLKGIKHDSFSHTIEGELALGNTIVKGPDGRYYSKPITKPAQTETDIASLDDLLPPEMPGGVSAQGAMPEVGPQGTPGHVPGLPRPSEGEFVPIRETVRQARIEDWPIEKRRKLLETAGKMGEAEFAAGESEAAAERLRGTAVAGQATLTGATLGIAPLLQGKDVRAALAPQGTREQAIAAVFQTAGGALTGLGMGKGIGAAVGKAGMGRLAGLVATRGLTSAIQSGTNNAAQVLQGDKSVGEGIRDTLIGVFSSTIGVLPENLVKSGYGNLIAQVGTDFAVDLTTDAVLTDRLKDQGFVKWFLTTELPQLATSIGFAADDLRRFRADPEAFEAARGQIAAQIKRFGRGAVAKYDAGVAKAGGTGGTSVAPSEPESATRPVNTAIPEQTLADQVLRQTPLAPAPAQQLPVTSFKPSEAPREGGSTRPAYTSLITPDGTAFVGERAHPLTLNKAIDLGLLTMKDAANLHSGFTRLDGTSYDLQGKPIPTKNVVWLEQIEKQLAPAPATRAAEGAAIRPDVLAAAKSEHDQAGVKWTDADTRRVISRLVSEPMYRGTTEGAPEGIGTMWTIDKATAEGYARSEASRTGRTPLLLTGRLNVRSPFITPTFGIYDRFSDIPREFDSAANPSLREVITTPDKVELLSSDQLAPAPATQTAEGAAGGTARPAVEARGNEPLPETRAAPTLSMTQVDNWLKTQGYVRQGDRYVFHGEAAIPSEPTTRLQGGRTEPALGPYPRELPGSTPGPATIPKPPQPMSAGITESVTPPAEPPKPPPTGPIASRKKIRGFQERVVRSAEFAPNAESIKRNPNTYYEQQNFKDIKGEYANAADQDLEIEVSKLTGAAEGSHDQKNSILAAAEWLNRAPDDAEIERRVDVIGESATSYAQLLRAMAEIQTTAKMRVRGVATKLFNRMFLKKYGKVMSEDQQAKHMELALRLNKAVAEEVDARQNFLDDETRPNGQVWDKTAAATSRAFENLSVYEQGILPKNVSELYRAAMQGALLSPLSGLRSGIGNSVNMLMESAYRGIGSVLDAATVGSKNALAKLRGQTPTAKRALGHLSPDVYLRNMKKGMLAAIEVMVKGRATGDTVMGEPIKGYSPLRAWRMVAEPGLTRTERLKTIGEGLMGLYQEPMFRLQGAVDALFRKPFEEAIYDELARIQNLSGEAKENWIRKAKLMPDSPAKQQVTEEARRAVWQSGPAGDAISDGMAWILNRISKSSPIAGGITRVALTPVLPFTKTMANIAVDFGDLVMPKLALVKAAVAVKKGNVRAAERLVGKAIIGQTLLTAGAWLLQAGVLTGRKKGDKEKRLDYETAQPGSFNVSALKRLLAGGTGGWQNGDYVVRTIELGLPGMVFDAVANIGDILKKADGNMDNLSLGALEAPRKEMLYALPGTMIGMSALRGVTDLFRVMSEADREPGGLDKWLASYIGTLIPIPSALGQIKTGLTENMTTVKSSKGLGDHFTNAIKRKLGIAEGMPLVQDMWGRAIPSTPPGATPVVYQGLSPLKGRTTPADNATMGVKQVFDATDDGAAIPSEPDQPDKDVKLSERDMEKWRAMVGKERLDLVTALIHGDTWQDMSMKAKVKALASRYEWGRSRAKRKWKKKEE